MTITAEKTSKVLKHYSTIYTFILMICSGTAYAINEYHDKFITTKAFNVVIQQQTTARNLAKIKEKISNLNDEIADLTIERKYFVKTQDKNRVDEKIIRKKTQIKNLKGE